MANKAKANRGGSGSVVEFTAAAHEYVEPAFDVSGTPGAAQQTLGNGPIELPANGFLRHVYLLVTTSGGSAGQATPAFNGDGPWNVLQTVEFLDVNGAPIVQLSGYQLFLANIFGGYAFRNDPRVAPDYSNDPTDFAFALRIPIEILHNNGLGAIANMNSAASYKVRLTLADSTVIWATEPDTLPVIRVQGFVEAWTLPAAYDLAGRPQAQVPPRHGTTQFHTAQTYVVPGSGEFRIRHTRVGAMFRNLILVLRDDQGDRAALPDPFRVQWDQREILNEAAYLRRDYGSTRTYLRQDTLTAAAAGLESDSDETLGGYPEGVYVYSYAHDVLNKSGDGTPELFLPTLQQTRFEFIGTFGAAGTLEVITNDVAAVEVNQMERYEEDGTGFRPGIVAAPMGT